MTVDLDKLNFTSSVNYMKRDTTNSGSGTNTTFTITHSYGYIPFFEVYVDIDNDGVLWAGGEKVEDVTDSSLGLALSNDIAEYWSTTTAITINVTSSLPTHYLVYLDYGSS